MTESEDRLCPVFIIESPSADDFYDKTAERQHIANVLHFHQIPSEVRVALDREKFKKALDEFVSHVAKHSECPPILHVSAHGEVDGICFTDGECISWQEFCQLLKPAARQVNGGLIICMSSCHGACAKEMQQFAGSECTIANTIIASEQEIAWADTAIGFATFYHQRAIGNSIDDSLNAMKIASGNETFKKVTPACCNVV